MGVVILLVMAAGVVAMLSRKLPTAFALVLLAVVIAFLAGAPLSGKDSVLDTVLQEGAPALAATMIAILLGSWLGKLLEETGIAGTLVRKIVEFGGDRPVFVAFGVLAVSALVGTVTGSAPAAMLAGLIGIPAMIAVGIPKVTAAGTILMGIAVGVPFELPVWQFFSTALDLPIDTVRGFMVKLFPFALVAAVAYVLVESRRRGVEHTWSLKSVRERPSRDDRRRLPGDAPWYALLTPAVPLALALGLDVAIIPALLGGVAYALVTTTRPREMNRRLLRTLYGGFEVAAPPITLFVAIGILLAAVKLPGAIDALEPLVKAVSPQNAVLFVLVFTLLVPLCLFRGPLNVFGLGAGIAGVLIATGIYPAVAVLGMTASYNQVFGVADPTSTQTVWSAQYAGVSPHQVMVRTLPYVWAVAFGGLCVTASTHL
ncbi:MULTISPECIES: TRAP transporter large permease [Streptomyces]|uniref:TRAP transporter large permease subunit n=1 Tax=Streptomyces TaxID=1883 RepID=UPI00081D9212|nr:MULTISPECIES: TRAP transporter large permease subunit [unclassified Streptomyces]MCC4316087.1 TRAP transporter large permease subunit [Streptomyces malaysiensis]MYU14441.1 TRAP transporter large permease subunit [Streptomyces sp. SID8361]MCQ6248444.1 TRAP transporter large permease subunit [Streptomyces malaysiensis]WHX22294.1 TRAP transporter large permease subunit [Streptomyces sp. NA07423]SCG05938.1 Tripartite ATP-independent transporter, DctM component [Streptomyces sp. MnatMP-M27]